jgi:hypothetical protein
VDGGWGVDASNSVLTNVVTFSQEVLLNAGLSTFLLHEIGRVRTITRIHREATAIELWNVRPHNAFARVTVLAAILIILFYVSAAISSALSTRNSVIAAVLAGLALIIATVVFIGPLIGMRQRLVREKEKQLGETDRAFEVVATRLRADVAAGDLAHAAGLNDVISGLVAERERLKKVSAWPWSADTLRAFLTSLGVPIVLWLVTSLLGRLLFA